MNGLKIAAFLTLFVVGLVAAAYYFAFRMTVSAQSFRLVRNLVDYAERNEGIPPSNWSEFVTDHNRHSREGPWSLDYLNEVYELRRVGERGVELKGKRSYERALEAEINSRLELRLSVLAEDSGRPPAKSVPPRS